MNIESLILFCIFNKSSVLFGEFIYIYILFSPILLFFLILGVFIVSCCFFCCNKPPNNYMIVNNNYKDSESDSRFDSDEVTYSMINNQENSSFELKEV